MMPGTWRLYDPEGRFVAYLYAYEVWVVTSFFQCVTDVGGRKLEML